MTYSMYISSYYSLEVVYLYIIHLWVAIQFIYTASHHSFIFSFNMSKRAWKINLYMPIKDGSIKKSIINVLYTSIFQYFIKYEAFEVKYMYILYSSIALEDGKKPWKKIILIFKFFFLFFWADWRTLRKRRKNIISFLLYFLLCVDCIYII